jgi:NADPH2:quinone reductase
MKAVVLTELGGPENLKPTEVDRFDGPLPEGTIRVKMAMVGVSGAEVYARRGDKIVTVVENGVTKQMVYEGVGLGKSPYVAGKEGAGEVIEVGPGVANVKVGDRVVWFSAQLHKPYTGAMAEECVLHAKATTPVPEDISWGDAISMISTALPPITWRRTAMTSSRVTARSSPPLAARLARHWSSFLPSKASRSPASCRMKRRSRRCGRPARSM